jgi:myo-inositol-1(or 4)-monophosphatase
MRKVNFDKEIEIAIKAAKSAGQFLKKDKNNLNLQIKSNPKDTKLMADIESEKLILDILNSQSTYPILAEEGGKSSENLGEIFWVVDPLDGTANYNRNIPICCVSIGLVKNMKPLIGVIFDFNNNDLFIGDNINKFALLNDKKITVSNIHNKADGVLITGLPFNTDYSNNALKKLILDMQTWKKVRMIGSAAMASCYVAAGKAELYKEKGIYLWDIIAGAAIVESAGGKAQIDNINEAFQVDVTFSNSKI